MKNAHRTAFPSQSAESEGMTRLEIVALAILPYVTVKEATIPGLTDEHFCSRAFDIAEAFCAESDKRVPHNKQK